jgi:hypothetical protein
LVRFLPGAVHPWLLLVRPHVALIWWRGRTAASVRAGQPGLSAGVSGDVGWFTVVRGMAWGVVRVSAQRARVYWSRAGAPWAPVALTPSPPLWVVARAGLERVEREGPSQTKRVRWPASLLTTVQILGGRPDLVLDAPAHGYWFDAATGRFQGTWAPSLPQFATTLGVAVSPQYKDSAPWW